jgi:lysophospholipid acyltransferase
MKTNVWIRECVYERGTPAGKKPGNMSRMITFFTGTSVFLITSNLSLPWL